jgi:hypothetical protein
MKARPYRGRIAMHPYQSTIFYPFQPERDSPQSSFLCRGAWQCARRSVTKSHQHTATFRFGLGIIRNPVWREAQLQRNYIDRFER